MSSSPTSDHQNSAPSRAFIVRRGGGHRNSGPGGGVFLFPERAFLRKLTESSRSSSLILAQTFGQPSSVFISIPRCFKSQHASAVHKDHNRVEKESRHASDRLRLQGDSCHTRRADSNCCRGRRQARQREMQGMDCSYPFLGGVRVVITGLHCVTGQLRHLVQSAGQNLVGKLSGAGSIGAVG